MLGLLIRDKLNLEHVCGAPFVLSSCGHCYKGGEHPKINGTKRCSPHRNFMKTMCTYMDRQSDRLQKRKLLPEYLDVLGVPMGKTIMDDILRD